VRCVLGGAHMLGHACMAGSSALQHSACMAGSSARSSWPVYHGRVLLPVGRACAAAGQVAQ
jgi:hypothetical protein